ncbi:MAG: hypothetical protein ACI9J2_000033 [Saprospiraceae bacterium]|jgi:hypothetical protein
MELQIALSITGIAIVALVIIPSLFPAVVAKLKGIFSKNKSTAIADRSSNARQGGAAPRLDVNDAALLGEKELLDDETWLYNAPLVNDTLDHGHSDETNAEVAEPSQPEVSFTESKIDEEKFQSPTLAGRVPQDDSPAVDELPSRAETTYDNPVNTHSEPFEAPEQPISHQPDPLLKPTDQHNNQEHSDQQTSAADTSTTINNETDAENQEMSSQIVEVQITPTETFTSLKQIDYWVKLICNAEYTKPLIMQQFGSVWNEMALNAQIHGLNTQDSRWHDFNNLPSDATFKEFVISIQLLNNGQPHSANTLKRFTNEVDQVAENLGASTQYLSSASEAAVQSANLASLYANCQGHIEVLINPTSEQPFYGRVIETSAKLQGLEYEAGQYVRKKQVATGKVILYTLGPADGSKFFEEMGTDSILESIKFSMRPSAVVHPGRVVKEMLDSAKAYASRVKGELQVFDGLEYHQDQLREVRDYVSKIESKMEELGIPAGSAEATRLFS